MNFQRGEFREEPEINFIPLIDVLLVILIFLMVTTTYQRYAELQINLPEADADKQKRAPATRSTSRLDAQGRYVVDRKPCSPSRASRRSPTCCAGGGRR